MPDRPSVLVALPNLPECGRVADWLAAEGFESVPCVSPRTAREEMRARTFDLLVTDAGFAFRDGLLAASRRLNPSHPTVVIGEGLPAEQVDVDSSSVMCLGRPVERAMLVCRVSMALLDGRPIRRSTRRPASRFTAAVNGVPSRLVDVSSEGLRLEMPRHRLAIPPPRFSVKVPLVGGTVTVQRVWARPSIAQDRSPVTLCGCVLAPNPANAERAWRVFVEMIPIVGDGTESSLQVL